MNSQVSANEKQAVAERDRQIASLNQAIVDRDGQIASLNQVVSERDASYQQTLNHIWNSMSWRITGPLRRCADILTGIKVKTISISTKGFWLSKVITRKISPENLKNLPAYIKSGNLPLVIKETLDNYNETLKRKDNISPTNMNNIKGFLGFFGGLKLRAFVDNASERLKIPPHNQPRISVILVLYNKAAYTFQCLESIMAHADVPYELVIVNNASDDDTGKLLSKVLNARIIINDSNVGFLKACNQGALEARSDWLLFLNNDTQILPNLFSSLIETAEQIRGCGAVGGKLILPDGTLQEAGSIIWNDGSCLGYGRGDDPWKPAYSYLREVDYCSGACLMVRAALFRNVGMFDELYAPAYYEETDLCMSIRKQGYKVIYQPRAELIHYEFGSSDSREKALAQQRKNAELFRSKWAEELKSHSIPGAVVSARDRNFGRTKILFIEDRVPDPTLGSGFPRSFDIINTLVDLGAWVTVFPAQIPERMEPTVSRLQQRGVEIFYGNTYEKLDLRGFLQERSGYYDLIWVCRPHNLADLNSCISAGDKRCKVVYDAEAIFAVRDINKAEMSGVPLTERQKRTMLAKEIGRMAGADVVLTVSDIERRIVEDHSSKSVRIVSLYRKLQPTQATFKDRQDILFVGGFLGSPSPNEDAMHYFVREIFPLIRKEINVKLWIVGTNKLPSIENLASEHVTVTGTVPCLDEYFNKCRVFVVPTRYAAGIPLKLLEAMSYGIPAVVTPLIADQLELDENVVLIGRNSREFAEKVIACYNDESMWLRLRGEGLRLIGENYSREKFADSILDVLKICDSGNGSDYIP